MSSRLRARVPLLCEPKRDESIRGYLARVAARNCFPRAKWIADLADVEFPRIWYSDDEIERLSKVTGQKFARLRWIAPSVPRIIGAIEISMFLGQEVPSNLFIRKGRRVCPECLNFEAYHRAVWDLRFSSVCVRHGRELVSYCPSECSSRHQNSSKVACAQRNLPWTTGAPDRCACLHSLTSVGRGDVRARVGYDRVLGIEYLQRIFLNAALGTFELLRGLSFAECFVVIRGLGHFGRERDTIFQASDRPDPLQDWWLSRGVLLASVNPESLEDHLFRWSSRRNGRPTWKYLQVIARIVSDLRDRGPCAARTVETLNAILWNHADVVGDRLDASWSPGSATRPDLSN